MLEPLIYLIIGNLIAIVAPYIMGVDRHEIVEWFKMILFFDAMYVGIVLAVVILS